MNKLKLHVFNDCKIYIKNYEWFLIDTTHIVSKVDFLCFKIKLKVFPFIIWLLLPTGGGESRADTKEGHLDACLFFTVKIF